MALTFVRLKLRLMVNGLRGRGVRVTLFILGLLFGIFFAVAGYAIFAIPGFLDSAPTAELLLTLGGAGVMLGWLFLPLVFFGVDESLDPARFALLPLPRRTLITGMFAASLAGIPAVATLGATAGMVHTAARLGGVAAGLVQAVGVVLGLLLCASISRSVTSAFANALRSRRARDLATVLLAVMAALFGPLQLAATAGAQHADWDRFRPVAAVVAWTPLGAPYSMGLDVAAGRAWTVPIKLVIIVAAIGGLLWWWSATIERAMLGTASAGVKDKTRSGTPVDQLMFRWLPRTRFGALTAREARYWWRETRRRASLITFAVVGVFLPVMLAISGGGAGAMSLFVGALAAVGLANQFGYEGSAYAANVVAGVPGRAELQSRVAGYALYVLPLMLVIALVVGFVTGDPASIPARFGLLIASFGTGLAVILSVSVRGAYALPDTQNPFAINSGGGITKGLLSLVGLVAAILGTLPLQLAAYFLGDAWTWIGLPVGLAWGFGAYWLGCYIAGDHLDRRMPELLAAVTQNH
jgi:ABC-2 type transport system permease protein